MCRRGCNTRTATYTDEFAWEEMYQGEQDLLKVIDLVEKGTKANRLRRAKSQSPQEAAYRPPQTPTKSGRVVTTTPQSNRSRAEPGSRSKKYEVCCI